MRQRIKTELCFSVCAMTLGSLMATQSAFAENSFLDNVSGNISIEGRYFTSDPAFDNQSENGGVSVSFAPEYKYRTENDSQFKFAPFFRWDDNDEERTHADIRELDYVFGKDDWEIQFGISKKFWGVTESQHFIDIINQTDSVEGPDGEDKLGQPLLRYSKLTDNGALDLFVLPYFRERTFPGEEGRLRTPLVVDTDNATFESKSEEKHIDYAFRFSESYDEIDFGISYFDGTSREPLFVPTVSNNESVLVPHYPLIHQLGLDLQYTGESIIWKFEGIHRKPKSDESGFDAFSAAVGGFEYTLPTITEAGAELGVLAEYHNDSRGEDGGAVFQNDLFLGARLALNDEDSTEVLFGGFVDLDNSSKSFRVEGSRRLGSGFKINLEAQFFTDIDEEDPFETFASDDYIQLELQKFF